MTNKIPDGTTKGMFSDVMSSTLSLVASEASIESSSSGVHVLGIERITLLLSDFLRPLLLLARGLL